MSGALKPLSAVRDALLGRLEPVAVETLPLQGALGLVLAAALTAPEDLPRSPLALRDGVAVRALDTVGPAPTRPRPCRSPPRSGLGNPASRLRRRASRRRGRPTRQNVLGARAGGSGGMRPPTRAGLRRRRRRRRGGRAAQSLEMGARPALRDRRGRGQASTHRHRFGQRGRRSPLLGAAGCADRYGPRRPARRRRPGRGSGPSADRRPTQLAGNGAHARDGAGADESGGRPAIFVPPRPEAALAVWLGLGRPAIARLPRHSATGSATPAEFSPPSSSRRSASANCP